MQHRVRQYGRHTTPPRATAQRYAQPWVLFTTATTVAQAVTAYAQRMSIAEPVRAWHTGWGVRLAVVDLPSPTMVDRLIGVVCLTYSLQRHLGQRLSAAPRGQRRRRQWTVTDRVSWFWCGPRLFNAPGYDWRDWLAAQWAALALPHALIVPEPAPIPLLGEAAQLKGEHSPGTPPPRSKTRHR